MEHGVSHDGVTHGTARARYDVLAVSSEAVFERITRLVTRCLDVPIALVCLGAPHRQRCERATGLAEPLTAHREVELACALSDVVVGSGAAVCIDDVRGHPLVRGGRSRLDISGAYLSVPIRVSSGEVVGSLCAMSRRPRTWSSDDQEVLEELAASATDALALRHGTREERRRRAAEQASTEAPLDTSTDLFFVLSPSGKLRSWNPRFVEVTGYDAAALGAMEVVDFFRPNDRSRIYASIAQVLERGALGIEADILSKGKASIPYAFNASALLDEAGEVVGVCVTGRARTERPQAQRIFREGDDRLRLALEAAQMGTWDWDLETGTLVWSAQTYALFGLVERTTVPSIASYLSLVHPDDREEVRAASRIVATGEGAFDAEYRIVRPGGEVRWMSSKGRLFHDATGRPARVTGTVVDVTRSKQAEAALRESENRYRIVTELTGQVIYDYDVETGRIAWRGAIEKTTGYSPAAFAEFDIDGWKENVHPDDRQRAVTLLDEAKQGTGAYDIVYRFRDAEGNYRYIDELGVFLPDSTGVAKRMLGVMQDVTERKRVEDRLRESQGRYRALSELVSTFAFAYRVTEDRRAIVEWITETVEDVIGYAPAELVGKAWGFVVDAADREHTSQRLNKVLAGATVTDEIQVVRRDGEVRWLRIVAYPEWDEAYTRVVRIYCAAQDVTGRKIHELELLAAKEKAEQISHLKDAFLANMSHEIRTPLTAIIGFAEVLVHEVPDAQRGIAEMVCRGGRRLHDTLNSVLDLAQLKSGVLVLQPERIDVVTEVRSVAELFEPQAREKGIALRTAFSATQAYAVADRSGLHRVITNFLSNAIKFTEEGAVTVRVEHALESVVIAVEDTGVGIDPAFLPNLFEEFRQESVGLARTHEGNGLGLAIVKQLADLMNGEVEVESRKQGGSTFRLRLPLAVSSDAIGRA